MGAGASIPEDKRVRFKEKLLVVETLSDQQKMRLLEQMSHELKKSQGPPSEEVSSMVACIKIVHGRQPFERVVGTP